MTKIITSAVLVDMIKTRGAVTVIGRACLALYARQTADEQNAQYTKNRNGVGFTAFDAKVGSLTAIYYRQYRTLLPWHVEYWSRPTVTGYPKIARYSKQLNEIALENLQSSQKMQSQVGIIGFSNQITTNK